MSLLKYLSIIGHKYNDLKLKQKLLLIILTIIIFLIHFVNHNSLKNK